MTTLAQYLEGRSKAEFAQQIGVRPDQLSQYLSGYRRPSYERMLVIASVTDGAVPVDAWGHTPAHDPAQDADQGAVVKTAPGTA